MIYRLQRWLYARRWPRCCCGQMRVARGCRVELRGVSHGETPCFMCDAYGHPMPENTATLTEWLARPVNCPNCYGRPTMECPFCGSTPENTAGPT